MVKSFCISFLKVGPPAASYQQRIARESNPLFMADIRNTPYHI